MANIKELAQQIRKLGAEQEHTQNKIEISFELLNLYRTLKKPTKTDIKDCCYTAVVLSGVVQKGLGGKVKDFLADFEHTLPPRAVEVLRSNIMRMEGF